MLLTVAASHGYRGSWLLAISPGTTWTGGGSRHGTADDDVGKAEGDVLLTDAMQQDCNGRREGEWPGFGGGRRPLRGWWAGQRR